MTYMYMASGLARFITAMQGAPNSVFDSGDCPGQGKLPVGQDLPPCARPSRTGIFSLKLLDMYQIEVSNILVNHPNNET